MIEPAQLGITFGNAPKRSREDLGAETPATNLLILHGPTLLDAARDAVLWAEFTGRTHGGKQCSTNN